MISLKTNTRVLSMVYTLIAPRSPASLPKAANHEKSYYEAHQSHLGVNEIDGIILVSPSGRAIIYLKIF